jgi:pimeloyl-ACP methyl ester carboxylesterase
MIQKLLIAPVFVMATLTGCETMEQFNLREGFAPVPNGQLYYQMAGAGDTVVLLHGIAGDHRHWDKQFELLASRFSVIRYDVRGWGQSTDPVIGSPFSDFSDLAALLNFLEVRSAHIVGWSFGSGIAFDFVTAYPDRAKSLVSVGPWVYGYHSNAIERWYERVSAIAEVAAAGGADAAANAFVDIGLEGTVFEESVDAFIRNVGSESSFWRFTHPSQEIALKPSAASQLNSLEIPILVVTSEYDLPACRDMADFIVSNAQTTRLVLMEATGHLMHIEKSEEFNTEVLDFLDDPPQSE